MKRRNVLAGALLSIAALALGGCWPLDRTARVKLHVDVMTSQGLKSGGSVLELIYQSEFVYDGTFQRTTGLRGQAVAIDLPGGPVFALLRVPGGSDPSPITTAIMDGLAPVPPGDDPSKGMKDQVEKISCRWFCNLKTDLPRDDWPLMVRFRNINDPKSVEQVDPVATGVAHIWVESTSDPVSTGIEKRLRWLPNVYHMGIGSDFQPANIPVGDFQHLFTTVDYK